MSSIGKTVKVSGPLIIAEGMADAKMYERRQGVRAGV